MLMNLKPLLLPFAVVIASSLAGCSDVSEPTDAADATTPPDSPSAPTWKTFETEGVITAGVGGGTDATGYYWLEALVTPEMYFDVNVNATAILVEVAWAPPFDLDVKIAPAEDSALAGSSGSTYVSEGMPGMPDTPLRHMVEAPKPGEWLVMPHANGAAAQIEYKTVVTVFYDGMPPDDYSGL